MLICQLTISLTIAFNSWRQYNRMLYDLSQVDLAAKSLKVTKRTQWSSYSIMPATYTSMLFALIYIDSILQPAKRLLVQFPCLSFYKYISLVTVKATHNTLLLLILSIDLIYFSMRPRLLGARILLVVIETPSKHR